MRPAPRSFLAVALAVLVVSCSDRSSPTRVPVVDAPFFSILEEGGLGGLPGFSFQPPIAHGDAAGQFDDGLADLLAVEICEWSDDACVVVVRTITSESAAPARLRIDDTGPAYLALWQTKKDHLDPDKDYRIRVLASGSTIGWADVDILRDGSEEAGDGRVGVKNGSTLPIRFWIPVGFGERVGAEGGTLVLADGMVMLDLPPGTLSEDVLITATPAELPPDAPPFVAGTAWDFGPDGLVFDEPVTLTIMYDPANLPPGTDESELRIHELVDGTFVQQDAGTIDVVNKKATALVSGFSVYVLLERLFPGSPEDLLPPALEALDVLDPGTGTYGASATIDVSAADVTVDVHLALTDNNSGVAALQVLFRSPSGAQLHTSCYPFDPSVPRPPDSGNDTKGDWICPTIWPQYSEPGTWTVYYVNLADKVRNSVTYFRYGGGDLCDSRTRTDCLDTPPEVVVASTPADVTRPTATSLTVSLATVPRSFGSSIMVDPSAGGVSVVFGLDATDDLAGIGGDPNFDRDPYFYGVNLTGPSGQGYGWYCSSTPVTGTTRDGFFECYSYIPPAAEEGTWRITYLSLTDRVGNTNAYEDDGTGRICNTDGDCLTPPTVQVGGMGDAEAPMIQTYSLSVTGDEVTIDVGVTDVGIGADFVRVNYYSQTSDQYQYCDAALTSGTGVDGIWSCTITFSEFAARGEWRPRVDLRDQAFNFRNYTRGSDDGILCYSEGGTETCQDFGDTDVILR